MRDPRSSSRGRVDGIGTTGPRRPDRPSRRHRAALAPAGKTTCVHEPCCGTTAPGEVAGTTCCAGPDESATITWSPARADFRSWSGRQNLRCSGRPTIWPPGGGPRRWSFADAGCRNRHQQWSWLAWCGCALGWDRTAHHAAADPLLIELTTGLDPGAAPEVCGTRPLAGVSAVHRAVYHAVPGGGTNRPTAARHDAAGHRR